MPMKMLSQAKSGRLGALKKICRFPEPYFNDLNNELNQCVTRSKKWPQKLLCLARRRFQEINSFGGFQRARYAAYQIVKE
jgi:hypothetical protein